MRGLVIAKKIICKIRDLVLPKISFNTIRNHKNIFLYAGDVPDMPQYENYIGLSIFRKNRNHILHNINNRHELPDNCVDIYQAEDVVEHIPYDNLPAIFNDIYRILKPNGVFRLSIPDYRCDILDKRSLKNEEGEICFDPEGGGDFVDGKVVKGGHLWFPKYELVMDILNKSDFKEVKFYHYYDQSGKAIMKTIDYSLGFIQRTPDHDSRVQNPYRPLSIVVDCRK